MCNAVLCYRPAATMMVTQRCITHEVGPGPAPTSNTKINVGEAPLGLVSSVLGISQQVE